jgi:predicted HNH restriction endonuclease
MAERYMCWQCGEERPKVNSLIPLCKDCHRMFHITDKMLDKVRGDINGNV